jgi:predicted RNA binding protein YcfA (HicA-like mRNA interferase family)
MHRNKRVCLVSGYRLSVVARHKPNEGLIYEQHNERRTPIKIRDLQALLRKQGYHLQRSARGSHRIWTRPGQARPIVLVGSEGDDAPAYQVSRVCRGIRRSRNKHR